MQNKKVMKNFSFSPLIRDICVFFNQSKLKSSLSVATSINVLGNSFAYTFSVTKVVLCPIRYDMVLMSTPLFKAYEANVCRAMWNIQGEASNNEQVKIKRKSFEMSCISVFCKMWKMQTTTEY